MAQFPPFQADRVGLVDRIAETYLVRGTIPLIGERFKYAYNEIAAALKMDFKGLDFIDVCLIDNVSERWAFVPEMEAFGIPGATFPESYWPPYLQSDYKSKAILGAGLTVDGQRRMGRIVWWPIEGVPTGQSGETELGWPGWNFCGLVDYLRDLVTTLDKTVIYFHCMVGSDRTGAAHIGYLMRHKGLPKAEAIEKSKITQAPLPRYDYMNLIDAYAKKIGS